MQNSQQRSYSTTASSQVASRGREEKIDDSFFNHFVYEMIHQIIQKHLQRPRERQSQTELCGEVEQIGSQLGKRVTDYLAQNQDKKYPVQIDKTRFLCLDVWTYIFNHKVTQLKSNGMGACLIIDEKMEFLARLSTDSASLNTPEHKAKIQVYQAFIAGLIKGSLANLGAEGPIEVKLKMLQDEKS